MACFCSINGRQTAGLCAAGAFCTLYTERARETLYCAHENKARANEICVEMKIIIHKRSMMENTNWKSIWFSCMHKTCAHLHYKIIIL